MLINQAPLENADTEADVLRVENEYWKSMADALKRLKENDDFKKVILEGYFKDKAINGVSLLATDYVVQNNFRANVMEQLIAISQLEDYFATIENIGSVPPESEEE